MIRLIDCIVGFVADKDSTLRSLNNSGKPMFADPGHEKSRIFRTLDTKPYFGTKKIK